MWNGLYVLEVIKFVDNEESIKNGYKFQHIGYMKAKFKTKEDACSYYDRHNPHMRKLNTFNNYKSDWDPKTYLLYIVRKDYMLKDDIPPFSEDELPINGIYKYLK